MNVKSLEASTAGYYDLVRHEIMPLVPKGGKRLLDVGGGEGATVVWLKEHGYVEQAGVVDLISPERPDARLDFHVAGNLEDDAFVRRLLEQHGPFDVILCLDVLEHLADPWSVVRRLHEALAPDGVIVASIPNIRYFEASFPLFFRGKWTLRDSGVLDRTHLRWFVKQTACELMTSSGLVLERAISKPGRGRKMKWVMRATLGLLNDFFTVQFLIRVRNRSARF